MLRVIMKEADLSSEVRSAMEHTLEEAGDELLAEVLRNIEDDAALVRTSSYQAASRPVVGQLGLRLGRASMAAGEDSAGAGAGVLSSVLASVLDRDVGMRTQEGLGGAGGSTVRQLSHGGSCEGEAACEPPEEWASSADAAARGLRPPSYVWRSEESKARAKLKRNAKYAAAREAKYTNVATHLDPGEAIASMHATVQRSETAVVTETDVMAAQQWLRRGRQGVLQLHAVHDAC